MKIHKMIVALGALFAVETAVQADYHCIITRGGYPAVFAKKGNSLVPVFKTQKATNFIDARHNIYDTKEVGYIRYKQEGSWGLFNRCQIKKAEDLLGINLKKFKGLDATAEGRVNKYMLTNLSQLPFKGQQDTMYSEAEEMSEEQLEEGAAFEEEQASDVYEDASDY